MVVGCFCFCAKRDVPKMTGVARYLDGHRDLCEGCWVTGSPTAMAAASGSKSQINRELWLPEGSSQGVMRRSVL